MSTPSRTSGPASRSRLDAKRRLIMLSAAVAAYREAAGEPAKELMAGLDWAQLAAFLRARRLLPTLGPRIVEMAGDKVGPGFTEAVAEATETSLRQGAFLQLIGTRLMTALAQAGIATAPLKGAFLSEALYGDPGRRLASDIDLLVAPDQLGAAVEVVRGFDYGAPDDHVEADGLPQLHFAMAHERGELPPVELHWRIHWYERDFARERLLPAAAAAPNTRPAPVDELASLLLFYARDGFVDLRLATDLGAWWDRFGGALEDDELATVIGEYPALARALRAAAKAAEKTVGVPAARILGNGTGLSPRERLAVRLANPNPSYTQRSQVHADMGLIDGLLMPRGEFGKFLKRQVLLPRDLLDDRARHREEPTRSPLNHGVRVLARYGLTAARGIRPPESLPASPSPESNERGRRW